MSLGKLFKKMANDEMKPNLDLNVCYAAHVEVSGAFMCAVLYSGYPLEVQIKKSLLIKE